MKAEILKIAGVKSEKEFYDMYPTKEAFMKKHGKEFKKAKRGTSIQDEGQIKKLEQLLDFGNPPQAEIGAYVGGEKSTIGMPVNLQGIYDKYDMGLTGSTNALREEAANKKAALAASAKGNSGGGGGLGDIIGQIGKLAGSSMGGESGAGAADLAGGADIGELASSIARRGKKIPQAQDGIPYYLDPNSANSTGPYNGYNNPQDWAQSMYNPSAPNAAQANATAAIIPPYSPSYTGPVNPAAANAFTQTTPTIPNMVKTSKKGEGLRDFAKENLGPVTGGIISGIQALQEEKEQRRAAEQMRDLSALTLRATQSSAMQPAERRRYTTPDQYMLQSTQGTGSNFLSAQNGMQIGGNMTEIQNMYEPGDLYSDLGFEPLNDSSVVKQYQGGGRMFQFDDRPTRSDSLALFNDAVMRQNWFRQHPEYVQRNSRKVSPRENVFQDLNASHVGYLGQLADYQRKIDEQKSIPAPFRGKLAQSIIDENQRQIDISKKAPYKQKVDKHKFRQREISTSTINPNVPAALYDDRIKPQGMTIYDYSSKASQSDPAFGDRVEAYTYDPLAVLPISEFKRVYGKDSDKMLQKRNKIYGGNNTPTKKTVKPKPTQTTTTQTSKPVVQQATTVAQTTSAPAAQPGTPGGEPIYGPGNSLIGFMNKGEFTRYSGPYTSAMNKGDRELMGNTEQLNKYLGQKYGSKYVKPVQRQGGYIPIAQDGNFLSQFAGAGGGDLISSGMNAGFGENAGGNIGKGIGKTAGKAIGNAIVPGVGGIVGGMIGGVVGDIGGRLLDKNPQKIKKAQEQYQGNLQAAALTSGAQGIHAQNSAYVRNGGLVPYAEDGWMSHDWQPQVITQFGEHSMNDLLRPDPMMDTLRTGGHITQNNIYPQDRYALGGEIKTHWGGRAETISYNPYMPGTGETVMFKGQSHDEADGRGRTGIGVSYGRGNHDDYTEYAEDGSMTAADVEVERDEPGMEMIDPETGDKVFEVTGNLVINNDAASFIGDPSAKGMKYKHYVKKVSKDEAKQGKTIQKATDKMDSLEAFTPIERLTANSLTATMLGANMRLKDNASKKMNAATYQNATNETSDKLGIVADDFAKGKIKLDTENNTAMAKYGIEIADKGKKKKKKAPTPMPKVSFKLPSVTDDDIKPELSDADKKAMAEEEKAAAANQYTYDPLADLIKNPEDAYQSMSEDEKFKFDEGLYTYLNKKKVRKKDPKHTEHYSKWFKDKYAKTHPDYFKEPEKKGVKYDDLVTAANQALEYIRPTDQEQLDPRQLAGEMAALATNQLQPVEGYQMYQPLVQQQGPRISLQAQLNANQADFNAMQRQVGYNPAAMAALAAQKYAANEAVLGKEAEANALSDYAARDKAYGTFNEAQLRNQGLMKELADKRAAAKSLTRSEAINALQSISEKELKNKLENKRLGIMENMYKYRFDKKGRAVNMNPLVQWTNGVVDQGDDLESDSDIATFDQYQKLYDASKTSGKKKTSRNGSIVKAIKGL